MAAKIRTFVAVDIAPGVRDAIRRALPKLMAAAPQFNWIRAEQYHLTLAFLGDVADREIPEICAAFQQAVRSFEEFELEIVGLRVFPSIARMKYLWAGVGQGREELCALQAAVAETAQRLGFPRDRDVYSPHLTIARVPRGGQDVGEVLQELQVLEDKLFGISSIDEVVVYSSYLEKSGPTYVPMSTIGLQY